MLAIAGSNKPYIFICLGFGIAEPIGQLDFYPNGGAQQQGCGPSSFKLNNLISSVMDSLGCNHQRAIHLYSDSLLPNPYGCEIMAFECSDSKAFGKVQLYKE